MKLGFVARASSWLLSVALTALSVQAAPFSRVALLLPACEVPGLATSELRAAIALDLHDVSLTLAPAGELSNATDVLVQVATDCSTHDQFTVQAQFGDERHTRHVDLNELPSPQRARALSLALAELLALFGRSAQRPSASSSESAPVAPATAAPTEAAPAPALAPTPKPSPTPSGPQAPDRSSTKRATAPWSLSVAPELRFFDTNWLWGGRAMAHYGVWSAGLDALRAEQNVPPGRVTTLLLHGSLAYSAVVSGRLEASRLEAGLRLGFGRTFMTAEASSAAAAAHDAQDVYLDAAFTARYSLQALPGLRFGLGAELGYARGPIGYADDVEVARTAGAFASVLLDVSVHP